jgi:hypothetical protein
MRGGGRVAVGVGGTAVSFGGGNVTVGVFTAGAQAASRRLIMIRIEQAVNTFLECIDTNLCSPAAHAWVHNIPQRVAHQVPPEDKEDERHTGIDHNVPIG